MSRIDAEISQRYVESITQKIIIEITDLLVGDR